MLNLAIMVLLAAVFQGCQTPIESTYYVEKMDQSAAVDLALRPGC